MVQVRRIAGLVAGVVLVVGVMAGCSSSNGAGGGAGANLVSSNCTPADGNATIDNAQITFEPNAEGTGYDRVTCSQTVGTVGHEITMYYYPTTGLVHSVQHAWGPAAGGAGSLTQCVESTATTCPSSSVSVNVSGRTATFTTLDLTDPLGGTAVSRLNGTLSW